MAGSVVLLSGGMDSSVAALIMSQQGPVHALTIEYSQRHWVEISAAKKVVGIVGCASHVVTHLGPQGVGFSSALTSSKGGPVVGAAAIVPGRNMMFLTLAAARAQALGLERIAIGCCADDAAVFPDCRAEFLIAARNALRLALAMPGLDVVSPFIDRTKAQIVNAARAMTAGADVLSASWSCYSPVKNGPHCDDVEACGECSACLHRARGFAEAT